MTISGHSIADSSGAPAEGYAVEVISYGVGAGATPGFTNPTSALGEPTRFTGAGIFPSVVSPFSPPFASNELVSIGLGGHLTLRLGTPAVDRAEHPYGIDLLLFSNGFFIDADYPNGIVGGLFGAGEGTIELSADGIEWHLVRGVGARDAFPTLGYLDSGPFDTRPGVVPSDFHSAVDPSIDPDDLIAIGYDELLDVYAGSGGGTGIDLAWVGLATASFVRIAVAPDAPNAVPIDAVTVIPARRARVFADLNGDGIVDGADLGILLANWMRGTIGDLNGDGVVDGADLGLLLQAWTTEG